MTRRALARTDWISLAIILSAAAGLTFNYFDRVDRPNYAARLILHNQIIAGTAPAPYRYRVLVPLVTNVLIQGLHDVLPSRQAFLLVYGLYDFLAILVLLASLFLYLRVWYSRDQSLIGVLFVACTMPIVMRYHYFQPWSLLEPGLFALALLALFRKRNWLTVILIVLATLNRETGIVVPAAYLLTSLDVAGRLKKTVTLPKSKLPLSAAYFGTWLAVMVGLRYLLGEAPAVISTQELLARNLSVRGLFDALLNASLFLGFFWFFAGLGWRRVPRFLQLAALTVPCYLLTVAIWGVWREVRLLMPLYPFLLPLALSLVSGVEQSAAATEPLPGDLVTGDSLEGITGQV